MSIYVERSFRQGQKPKAPQIEEYAQEVIRELQDIGFIGEVEVLDPTWIEVAYTWSWPGSKWKEEAIGKLEANRVYPVGRYARWSFQGIADSIREGLLAGAALR